ncbi:NAD(P)/FAD-dependent oxidoreductase [Thermosyntropha sp.]|uniref:NAD(P)/FAD-dependent oxidoreductase n=1 Tax=Thermosyntropha sp. TaxID=2740820 RepID=UPI0025CDD9EE|nr:NAD(P)/FAD-dependent oxidoreductase [Thermosyntropha sp.]MBO8158693.1 NAD(P)/FAD-dependent oxidoreductase [Thermosyntropha sp.]
MKTDYDVIIVGAGPAGIFSAMEISQKSNLKVLLIEKGKRVEKRKCPIGTETESCINCKPCSIMSGWGGAGAFSDGKLTLTTEFGGWLDSYIGKSTLENLITYVDEIYVKFGAPDRIFGENNDIVKDLQLRIARAGLRLIPAKIRHMGTENTLNVLKNMYNFLSEKVTIKTDTVVKDIEIETAGAKKVKTSKGTFTAPYIILAPGRDGSQWFSEQARKLGIELKNNQVDLGVRVEVPAVTMQEFTDNIWEPKIIYNSKEFDDTVRTFCVNPNGHVVMENTNGIITVNGHSFANSKSNNTNFALLLSQEFTEPFDKPILYGRCIASLANMLSGSIIVQRYGDLKRGRRSTSARIDRGMVEPTLKGAVPGDLSLVLPHRYMVGIKESLEALDKAIPGIASDHTLLYGIEAKFYSARPKLNNHLETPVPGIWAIGDGAGVTRGLIQASVSGIIAARDILSR